MIYEQEIGRVLRASTQGFTCGTRSQEIHYPSFGSFVRTTHTNGSAGMDVIGLITGIRVDDDPLVRQLIMASNMNMAALRDQRENRMIPVEIEVIHIGYIDNDRPVYNLPPRPPLSLDPVHLCDPATIEYFTSGLDFLRLILNVPNISTQDLLAASIKAAAGARREDTRRSFLVTSGRRLAGLLSHDLKTLQEVLKMIRPTVS